ncbi:hypothetical protein [Fructobacillus evanidus]|uniref:Uncharacterized protein n=1 Tax=Fructobacillus evanidus TaxID=3064281 RepID=A0ABN9YWM2_9LACO|nr:unnamed protein product [Fructobacillus sp. LMG 32999]CAK1229792.1 unnamed protein product [Fructobacillus sp. LMG 32999]CAK1230847.1 unnamed protein product [Fructobacillus sp. LMG 32999]CAK1230916.1 unnamed protein product [Fructobacillus sp. LMG 32999]CAK1232052.1 unnamed protein product [Fructobacillus sp. LMG 32999]
MFENQTIYETILAVLTDDFTKELTPEDLILDPIVMMKRVETLQKSYEELAQKDQLADLDETLKWLKNNQGKPAYQSLFDDLKAAYFDEKQ